MSLFIHCVRAHVSSSIVIEATETNVRQHLKVVLRFSDAYSDAGTWPAPRESSTCRQRGLEPLARKQMSNAIGRRAKVRACAPSAQRGLTTELVDLERQRDGLARTQRACMRGGMQASLSAFVLRCCLVSRTSHEHASDSDDEFQSTRTAARSSHRRQDSMSSVANTSGRDVRLWQSGDLMRPAGSTIIS